MKIDDLYNDLFHHSCEFCSESKIKIIGIDGPTAAGKTIFADNFAKWIEKEAGLDVFIYRLDWTLDDRRNRTRHLDFINKSKLKFHLEAEKHMKLEKVQCFLEEVFSFNLNLSDNSRIFETKLENLYSRNDDGRLSGNANCKISKNGVIIVEGHYTLRSELSKFFDTNILLLSEKSTLIDRKVHRVSGYRDSEVAKDYFDRIDAPSFENHIDRFILNATHIIDNENYLKPFFTNVSSALNWIDKPKELITHNDYSKCLKNFFCHDDDLEFLCKTVDSQIYDLTSGLNKVFVNSAYNHQDDVESYVNTFVKKVNLSLENHDFLIDFSTIQNPKAVFSRLFPLSIIIKENRTNIFIVLDFYEKYVKKAIIWNGGHIQFKGLFGGLSDLTNKIVKWTLLSDSPKRKDQDELKIFSPTDLTIPEEFKKGSFTISYVGKEQDNISVSEILFKILQSNNCVIILRFPLINEVLAITKMSEFLGLQAIFLGSYLVASYTKNLSVNLALKEIYKKFYKPLDNLFHRDFLMHDKQILQEREDLKKMINQHSNFIAEHSTFLFLKNEPIQKDQKTKFLKELRLFLSSDNRLLRKRICQLIINEFQDLEIRLKRIAQDPDLEKGKIKFSEFINLQPTILAEVYLWLSLNNSGSILGSNIYDVRSESIDAFSHYLGASSKSSPIVIQSSLNALGPINNLTGKPGYLNLKKGAEEFSDAVKNSIFKAHILNPELKKTLYGIGIDHIDSRNDDDNNRSKNFLISAIETGSITHLVLDGSSLFDAQNKSKQALRSAYSKVAKYASDLIDIEQNITNLDKEICIGELNYIGDSELADIPKAEEIKTFISFIKQYFRKNGNHPSLLRPMLFIANVGTTHHCDSDNIGDFVVAKNWVASSMRDMFISPVLHGTTGSKRSTLNGFSNYCKKINVAGDFLYKFIDALPSNLKEKISEKDVDPKLNFYKIRSDLYQLKIKQKEKITKELSYLSSEILSTIDSPSLSENDFYYFHHPSYFLKEIEVNEIIFSLEKSLEKNKLINSSTRSPARFSASLIEVPYEEGFEVITSTLINKGNVRNFHLDVGDGKYITRKISAISKLQYLSKFKKQIESLDVHLMVVDPHLSLCEIGKTYIDAYAESGASKIGINLNALTDINLAHNCLQRILELGCKPGLIIEVDEPLNEFRMNLIHKFAIDWIVLMGVPLGYGGQIFQKSTIEKIRSIKSWFQKENLPVTIEVDGGLNINNVSACYLAGADVLAGWSIIKDKSVEGMLKNLNLVNELLAHE